MLVHAGYASAYTRDHRVGTSGRFSERWWHIDSFWIDENLVKISL